MGSTIPDRSNGGGAAKPDMDKAKSNPTRTPNPGTKTQTGDVSGGDASTGGTPRRS